MGCQEIWRKAPRGGVTRQNRRVISFSSSKMEMALRKETGLPLSTHMSIQRMASALALALAVRRRILSLRRMLARSMRARRLSRAIIPTSVRVRDACSACRWERCCCEHPGRVRRAPIRDSVRACEASASAGDDCGSSSWLDSLKLCTRCQHCPYSGTCLCIPGNVWHDCDISHQKRSTKWLPLSSRLTLLGPTLRSPVEEVASSSSPCGRHAWQVPRNVWSCRKGKGCSGSRPPGVHKAETLWMWCIRREPYAVSPPWWDHLPCAWQWWAGAGCWATCRLGRCCGRCRDPSCMSRGWPCGLCAFRSFPWLYLTGRSLRLSCCFGSFYQIPPDWWNRRWPCYQHSTGVQHCQRWPCDGR